MSINPKSIAELKKYVPVLGDYDVIDTGYILDVTKHGEIELRYYKHGAEIEEIFPKRLLCKRTYESIDVFVKTLKIYTQTKEVYVAMDYAVVLLAKLNGGNPEEYKE